MEHNPTISLMDDHVFIASSKDMIEISKPLLLYHISYFTFTRSYHNGERIYLTTHPHILQNYVKNKWYLIGNVEKKPNQYKPQTVFWSTLPHQEVYDNNVRAYDIDHGIFVIKPNNGYCDFYGFAAKKGNDFINNIFITKTEQLNKFILYFNDKALNLLKQADQSRLVLPFNNSPLTFLNDENDDNFAKLVSIQPPKNAQLSKRQIQCVNLITRGKTIKQIAEHTKLSSRTIEYYVKLIKNKLNCRNKAELIIKGTQLLNMQKIND